MVINKNIYTYCMFWICFNPKISSFNQKTRPCPQLQTTNPNHQFYLAWLLLSFIATCTIITIIMIIVYNNCHYCHYMLSHRTVCFSSAHGYPVLGLISGRLYACRISSWRISCITTKMHSTFERSSSGYIDDLLVKTPRRLYRLRRERVFRRWRRSRSWTQVMSAPCRSTSNKSSSRCPPTISVCETCDLTNSKISAATSLLLNFCMISRCFLSSLAAFSGWASWQKLHSPPWPQ